MSKRTMLVFGIGLLLGLLGLMAAVPVLAQTNTPPTTPTPGVPKGWGPGRGWGMGLGWGPGRSWAEFDAAAEALGLTPEELFSQLHSGKTLAEIAEARGVDLEKVWEAVRAARVQAMREAIQQAVKDGRMSQEQANWLLEGLERGYFPMGRGFGRGFWRGWDRGPRGCPGWNSTPATPTPSGSSS